MAYAILTMDGETFFLVPKREYQALADRIDLPKFPRPDADGSVEALPFALASIAREIILRRESVKMSQKDLAAAAGVRAETLNRLEKGKTTPDTATIAKIDRALKLAEKRFKRR